jgi:hypothetical protein
MLSFQPPERITPTLKSSGKETGPNIEPLTQLTKTAPFLNPTTGRVPNNALNPGSAEVPDSVKEADGAPAMTVVKEPHFPTKLQASSQIIDQHIETNLIKNNTNHPVFKTSYIM